MKILCHPWFFLPQGANRALELCRNTLAKRRNGENT